jgi:D-sedoheptulose 7-phosphate isomerase
MTDEWVKYVHDVEGLLCALQFSWQGEAVSCEEGFARWVDLTVRARHSGRTIYLVGNGASASMASHFAADLAKNGKLHTQVFSDLALITAISNDMGYESVFSEPLRRRARAGDVLVAISSSGSSPNILAAVRTARELEVTVVGLSAMGESNPLRAASDLSAYVDAKTYGEAETCHAAILHYWMDRVQQLSSGDVSG